MQFFNAKNVDDIKGVCLKTLQIAFYSLYFGLQVILVYYMSVFVRFIFCNFFSKINLVTFFWFENKMKLIMNSLVVLLMFFILAYLEH